MIIIAYIWVTLLSLTALFLLVSGIVEKNFDENHPVKKWWRKYVVDWAPDNAEL